MPEDANTVGQMLTFLKERFLDKDSLGARFRSIRTLRMKHTDTVTTFHEKFEKEVRRYNLLAAREQQISALMLSTFFIDALLPYLRGPLHDRQNWPMDEILKEAIRLETSEQIQGTTNAQRGIRSPITQSDTSTKPVRSTPASPKPTVTAKYCSLHHVTSRHTQMQNATRSRKLATHQQHPCPKHQSLIHEEVRDSNRRRTTTIK